MAPESEFVYLTRAELVEELKARFASQGEAWAGFPMPVPGFSMTIHQRYPFAALFEEVFPDMEADTEPVGQDEEHEEHEEEKVVNWWYQPPSGRIGHVKIVRAANGHVRAQRSAPLLPLGRLLQTFEACRAWDMRAELRAIKKLRRHLSRAQWSCYVLTGGFAEWSPRSGVLYIFRRLRPTIACSFATGTGRIIAILCSHPIGYYDDTWAGAMVPTDDLLSHLLLMRADEHYYWRISNQHQSRDLGLYA